MLQEGFAGHRQDQPVQSAVEQIELVDVHDVAAFAQRPLQMQHLVAMGRPRPLGRQPDDEAFQIGAQRQQHPLAREVDRRDLQTVPRTHHDQRVGREARHRLVHRRAAETGQVLQMAEREHLSRLERTVDDQTFDPVIGQFELVDGAAARRLGPALAADIAARHGLQPTRAPLAFACHHALPAAPPMISAYLSRVRSQTPRAG